MGIWIFGKLFYEREHIMSQFKKKLTTFSAMLAFLTMSSASTFALSVNDVINHTNNVGISSSGNRIDVEMNTNAGGGAVSQIDWQNLILNSNQHLNHGFKHFSNNYSPCTRRTRITNSW